MQYKYRYAYLVGMPYTYRYTYTVGMPYTHRYTYSVDIQFADTCYKLHLPFPSVLNL